MIRMSDIAVHAGVSRTTVSFVLNEKHLAVGISEETRSRVLRAADELGYRRNEAARQTISGQSRVLGFIVGERDKESDVVGRILIGALEEAEDLGYSIRVLLINLRRDNWQAVSAHATELRLAGAMCVYVREPALSGFQGEMARYGGVPVALVDSSFPQPSGIRVISDDAAGCREAISHLLSLGHRPRQIAFIGGDPSSGASMVREKCFRDLLAEQGWEATSEQITQGNWESERIAQIVEDLFSASDPEAIPTALFCVNDKAALGAIRTLNRLGLSVPGDVSVIGFADLEMAQYANPPVTTVAQPFHAMGRAAVRLLVETPECENQSHDILLPTHLIVRESTAPARAEGRNRAA
jgi:LacI family transcriptional regulator